MTGRAEGLTSSQRGRIAELYVGAALMAASGGRLSPFAPLADDDGVDLVVLDKATGAGASVQVKSWVGGGEPARPTVQFDVRKATFRPAANAALLALVLDPAAMAMEAAWLIPMADVPSLAVDRGGKYALAPSRSPASRDRYAPYRRGSAAELADALLAMISGGVGRRAGGG